jgi:carboxymethylenebutenolidase
MGGGFVLVLAAQQGDRVGAAVPFYGVLKEDYPDLSGLTAPVLGHFGERDDFTTPDAARALVQRIERESGVTPQLHFYPAGQAFFNDENLLGTYDPEHAAPAWSRTLAFLRERLG